MDYPDPFPYRQPLSDGAEVHERRGDPAHAASAADRGVVRHLFAEDLRRVAALSGWDIRSWLAPL